MGLIDTLCDLVRINSVNPAYPQGQPESAVQAYVRDFFRREGIAVSEQTVTPGRPNVIGKLPGRAPGRRIVFEAHCDTAGVEGMTIPPFAPELRNGRLYGRGTCDNKAGLAAMLHALADLKRSGTVPEAEIWVASTADEEYSFRGVVRLCEGLQADAAVVAEPTELRLVIASKGCVRWRTTVHGRAAHSSKPHLGINAIQKAMRLLAAQETDAQRLTALSHPLLGHPTLNVGVISGGAQINIVPERCWFETDRRLIPGEDPRAVLRDFEALAGRLRQDDPEFSCSVELLLEDWPLDTPPETQVARDGAAVLAALGLDPEPAGVAYGSDASKFARAGIPAILYGPGSIDQAHTADEFVEVEQVETAFRFYRDLMRRFV